jgi:hypothetical protein
VMAVTIFIYPSHDWSPFVRLQTSGATKWYCDIRNRFEFDNFRSHTRRNNRPNRWATDHNIRHCDLLTPLSALLIVQIERRHSGTSDFSR